MIMDMLGLEWRLFIAHFYIEIGCTVHLYGCWC